MATKMVTGFSELKYEINFKNGINYTGNGLYGPSLLKGAGSYLAGMAVAIPILNVDGRRHTNNFSKKYLKC